MSNAGQVRQDLLSVVAQHASTVIADMSSTTFCDSAGVTALVRAARQAAADGASLRVVAATPAVTRVLAITGVDRLIHVYPSAAAAVADPGDQPRQSRPRQAGAGHPGQAGAGLPGQADPGGRAPAPG